MNIAWLNHRDIYSKNAGGAERTIYEVSKELVGFGHYLNWISCQFKGSNKYEYVDGIKIIRTGGTLSSHLRNPLMLRRKPNDWVVIDDLAHVLPWGSEWFTNKVGTVFFRHLHERTLRGQVRQPLSTMLKFVEKKYSAIYRTWPFVTESNQSVKDLVNIGIQKYRIVRISPGVDTVAFNVKNKSEIPHIVYFGGMRGYKRPQEVVHIMKNIVKKYPDVHLDILGDGPDKESIRLLSHKLGLSTNISFRGRVGYKEVSDIVAKAWVNVHTSTAEGWGYSIMEASASGTPTVAYSVPGVLESVINGVNGRLVNNGDREGLYTSVMDILDDPGKMIHSSRKYAERFSWKNTAKFWEEHLRRVAEGFYS